LEDEPSLSTEFLLLDSILGKVFDLVERSLKESRYSIGSRIGLMNKLPIRNLSLQAKPLNFSPKEFEDFNSYVTYWNRIGERSKLELSADSTQARSRWELSS